MSTGQHELLTHGQPDGNRFAYSFLPGLLFVALIWLVHLLSYLTGADLVWLGVLPRNSLGLAGIFLSPLIHADLKHLLSNTFPLVLLSGFILFIHRWQGVRAIVLVYVLSGILTWLIGRNAYHIGASGVVYGMAGFLLFRGFFGRDRGALAVALAVLFLYSGLFYGLFPNEERVSWEGHLAGMLAGLVAALIYGKTDKPVQEAAEEGQQVPVSVTQRHVSSTFVPYYQHYSLQYTLPAAANTKLTYTLTSDTYPAPVQTKRPFTTSLQAENLATSQYDSATKRSERAPHPRREGK
ncbi:rhomboid family intramembrane serine protease [Pontibacter sp. Tf4]|uniref:rhomboid family intramembrane serine protease n=1 Tax=Pontibacter sp. Tf4 TaxID=2761620 RepID=UPI001625C9BA|nr:rhomboid family intramembrane serine protease [Pontibacter sp. Tf4]MBB6610756.1 rhomboid family intramembrane serine protease [Pontibacter sp. Tf4]